MGRTACTEPQCLYSRAIPLLPLWAVRPVQSLSACTNVYLHVLSFMPHFQHFLLQRIVPSHIEDGEVAASQGDYATHRGDDSFRITLK
jgi:hypothetical protein